MDIPNGKLIKVIFGPGLVQEGVVERYVDDELVLRLVDDSVFVILNPKQNVIAIRVAVSDNIQASKPVAITKDLEPTEFCDNHDLRFKNLADLRRLMGEEERARAQDLLKAKKNSDVIPEVKHEYPDFGKLRPYGTPLPKHSKKKA